MINPDLSAMNCQRVETCLVEDLKGDPDDWMMEPKYDGFRLIAHIHDDGVDTWTRSMKSQNGRIPYIDDELRHIFPPGTVIDGEIVALQEIDDEEHPRIVNDFEHVQSIMLSKPAKAVEKAQRIRPLDYIVFDIMYLAGNDVRLLPFVERRQLIVDAFNAQAPSTFIPERVSVTASGEATQAKHDDLVAMGFEGTICKLKDGIYMSGKRSPEEVKLKVQIEVDVVVVDVKPGTPGSEFDGMVGALIFGQPLDDLPDHIDPTSIETRTVDGVTYVIRGKCSGVTLTERKRLTKLWLEKPEELFGRVFSFAHMGKYPDGVKFRHPQFKRWRKDKPANEVCWHDG